MRKVKQRKPSLLVGILLFLFGTAFIGLGIIGYQPESRDVLGLISGKRYKEVVFTEVTFTKDFKYGEAKPYNSQTKIPLLMDIYEPKDDPISNRPVIVLVHGGGFVGGSKEFWGSAQSNWGRELALRGYVVLAINYRLLKNFNFSMTSQMLPLGILQAKEDAFAAVRWARANATTYKLDPTKIGMGGYSAGAITTYYTAYDTENVGTSGNPGPSSLITAGFSIAGGMLTADLNKIQNGEAPFLILHGEKDVIVPIFYAKQVETKLKSHAMPHQAFYYAAEGHTVFGNSTIMPRVIDFLYVYLVPDEVNNTKPTVLTVGPATQITQVSAKLSGDVTSDGGSTILERGFVYSKTNTAPTLTDSKKTQTGTTGTYDAFVTELSANTKYYARAYAQNAIGIAYGVVIDFTTTAQATAPIVVTKSPATAITPSSATVSGEVSSDGGSPIQERGVAYSKTATAPTTADSKVVTTGTTGTYNSSLTGLTPNTKYYARAYAKNAINTSYGSAVEFVTIVQAIAPTVKTISPATSITLTSAKVSGNVTSDGGSVITERGIVYSKTNSQPTITDSKAVATGTIGTFEVSLTNLTTNTKCYVRAYAKNSLGTSYGETISFTAEVHVPADTGFADNVLLYIGGALYIVGVLTFVWARYLNSQKRAIARK